MFTFAHSWVLLPPEGDVACGHFESWSGGLRAATKSILDQQNLLWFVTSEAGRSPLPRQLPKEPVSDWNNQCGCSSTNRFRNVLPLTNCSDEVSPRPTPNNRCAFGISSGTQIKGPHECLCARRNNTAWDASDGKAGARTHPQIAFTE